MIATILAYRSFNDIDIEFDDGLVVEHTTSTSFSQHSIQHPNHKTVIWSQMIPKQKDLGRLKRTLDGYRKMIRIHDDSAVDYTDADGSLVQHASYSDFLYKNMTVRKWKKRGRVTECTY